MEENSVPSSPLTSVLSSLTSLGSSPPHSPEIVPIQPQLKAESPSNLKSPMKQSQRLKRLTKPATSITDLLSDYSHWDFRLGNLTVDQANKILQEEEEEEEEDSEEEDSEDYISRQDFIKQSAQLDKDIENLINNQLPNTLKKPTLSDAEILSNHLANKKNHTKCSVCESEGDMVCCDGCPRSFHFSCFVPPLDSNNLPEGLWYCYQCQPRKIERKSTNPFLNKFLDGISKLNPSCFEISKDLIKEFQGVIQNHEGDYVDSRRTKTDRKRSNELRNNWENMVLKNMDSNPPKACFWCKKSRLVDPLIECEYCSLNWHLSCLNPPLSEPPNPDMKFMCPHHIEHRMGPIWQRAFNPCSLTIDDEEIQNKKFKLEQTDIDTWINNTQLKNNKVDFTEEESELITKLFYTKTKEAKLNEVHQKSTRPININPESVNGTENISKELHQLLKSNSPTHHSISEDKVEELLTKISENSLESTPPASTDDSDQTHAKMDYFKYSNLAKIQSKLLLKNPNELIHVLKSIRK